MRTPMSVTEAAEAPRDNHIDSFAGYPAVLTVQQVGKALQISEQTIRVLCQTRELKARKVGKYWRIPKAFLLEYIEQDNGNL